MKRALCLLLLVPALAGCSSSEPAEPIPPEPERAPIRASTAWACDGCFEMTTTWLPDGTLIVVESAGHTIGRSFDNGTTFEVLDIPTPRGDGTLYTQPVTTRGDAHVQTGPDGTLWMSMIFSGRIGGGGGGIRVMSSHDAGTTWATDTFVQTQLNPATNVADRQWLVFDEDRIYMTCTCVPAGAVAWFASDDAGVSFDLVSTVVLPARRSTPWGFPGLQDDLVVSGHFSNDCRSQLVQPLGISAAVASDPAGPWRSVVIDPPGGRGVATCTFPNAASNGTHVALAWHWAELDGSGGWNDSGTVVAFTSNGDDWTSVPWGDFETSAPQPWIEPLPDGRFATLAYTREDQVVFTVGDEQGADAQAVLGTTSGGTDLPHFAVRDDGVIAAVWLLDGQVQTAVFTTDQLAA